MSKLKMFVKYVQEGDGKVVVNRAMDIFGWEILITVKAIYLLALDRQLLDEAHTNRAMQARSE
jgi:hypothetical protein